MINYKLMKPCLAFLSLILMLLGGCASHTGFDIGTDTINSNDIQDPLIPKEAVIKFLYTEYGDIIRKNIKLLPEGIERNGKITPWEKQYYSSFFTHTINFKRRKKCILQTSFFEAEFKSFNNYKECSKKLSKTIEALLILGMKTNNEVTQEYNR